jgi:hypothetical protein
MNEALQSCSTLASIRRQRWLCFFLAFFLLYNPFQAAPHVRSALDVCHPASNRATVGASELQHFTPAAGWDSVPTVDFADLETPAFQPVVPAETPLVEPRLVISPQQFFGSGLWFRPPPAR